MRNVTTCLAVLGTSLALAFASIKLLDLVHEKQASPYIDEIFHIPQAQHYCNDTWSKWDPKITTLPGLYLVSYGVLKPLQILGFDQFCSLYALRLINVIGTVLNFILTFQVLSYLDKSHAGNSSHLLKLLSAFNVAIFPPLYFFTFLYYTDVWSTAFVLLTYCLFLRKSSKLLVGLTSVMAVLMRQTNIIWVGLFLIDKAWESLSRQTKVKSVQDFECTIKMIKVIFSNLFKEKRQKFNIANNLFQMIKSVLFDIYHLLIVCLMFVTFVVWNGSIVVGDKTAHHPVFHPMQNFYFLDFAMFFGFPFVILEVFSLRKKPPNLFVTVLIVGLCAALSESNKVEHPYLLADNRHLAFYVWKRIFGHSVYRRAVIPTYAVAFVLFYRLLLKRSHFMFAVGLTVCIFANLTPQHLFELRYFILPFVMWRLHLKQHPVVAFESLFFVAVNSLVVYLFLNKTFVWSSEPGVKQRFIW